MKPKEETPPRIRLSRGFTLVELMIVMVIIGVLMAFILTASLASARMAEETATQALIAKLNAALNDRMEALLELRLSPSSGDQSLCYIYKSLTPTVAYYSGQTTHDAQRAQVIALYDMVRREVPDVWFAPSAASETNPSYPINFGIYPYPYGVTAPTANNFVLPFDTSLAAPGLAMNGATYAAAAGFYKQVGYAEKGFDMLDNDGNGLVDDINESGFASVSAFLNPTSTPGKPQINNHKHITARSEMLYAILVEGQGPFGSTFTKDDFSSKEVQDTDNDGLLEFVDAWGHPLQFFRWPIYYQSDVQKGNGTYALNFEVRQLSSLDPNQQLVTPGWWSSATNVGPPAPSLTSTPYSSQLTALTGVASPSSTPMPGTGTRSPGVVAFETYFHPLFDPNWSNNLNYASVSSLPSPWTWDRSGPTGAYGSRRSFYTKFLVLSSGPDGVPGVKIFDDTQGALPAVADLMVEGFAWTDINNTDDGADDISSQMMNQGAGGFQ